MSPCPFLRPVHGLSETIFARRGRPSDWPIRPMNPLGKFLMILGGLLIAAGCLVLLADKIPYLGRLPGDIHVRRGSYSFYFPLTTCLVLSALLSLILALLKRR